MSGRSSGNERARVAKIHQSTEAKATTAQGERITLVRSNSPPIVAKRFSVKDGKLLKESVANVFTGLAWSKRADDAESFAEILQTCADRSDCCLIPGSFIGDDIEGKPFVLVTERVLAQALKKQPDSAGLAGLHPVGRERLAARLKKSITHSAWILLDADDAPGMPEEMRRLDIRERLAAFERLLPGISKAERVLSRSSSFRVRGTNEPPRRHGHAWLRVSDPGKIEVLRTFLKVASVNADLAFDSPRRARVDDPEHSVRAGDVIGHEQRTLFDLSVLIPGRLVFIAKPILDDSAVVAGYVLDAPGIVIENAGGGPVDISGIGLPSATSLAEYNRRTGSHTTITRSGSSVGVHVRGLLGVNTPIERGGVVKPLGAWLATMKPGTKLRCEAPFRASVSEAAFVAKHEDGSARVFDIGVCTTWTWPGPHRHEEGEPGERVVIGVDRLAMIEAAMLRGIDWMVRVSTPEQLAGIWLDEEVREVVVVWPPAMGTDQREALVARLRTARKRISICPPDLNGRQTTGPSDA